MYFPGVDFLGTELKFKKRKKNSSSLVYVLLRYFTSYGHAVTAKKCTKKRDARAKLLFCQSKPIAFLPFSLPSPSLLLKLPVKVVQKRQRNVQKGALHVPCKVVVLPVCLFVCLFFF